MYCPNVRLYSDCSIFSLLRLYGAHPVSSLMGTGGGGEQQGHEADHSPSASPEVKKTWIYTFSPPYTMV
jgi:hypothetical protein